MCDIAQENSVDECHLRFRRNSAVHWYPEERPAGIRNHRGGVSFARTSDDNPACRANNHSHNFARHPCNVYPAPEVNPSRVSP
jgi:hypothetical protein